MIQITYYIKTYGWLLFDNFLLVFACITLIAAINLLYMLIPTVYLYKKMIVNLKINVARIFGLEVELLAQILWHRQLRYAFVTLTWETIFSVTIYLFLFFLQLIDYLEKLMFIWKIVFAIIMAVFCFCTLGFYITCSNFRDNNTYKSSSFYNIDLVKILIVN